MVSDVRSFDGGTTLIRLSDSSATGVPWGAWANYDHMLALSLCAARWIRCPTGELSPSPGVDLTRYSPAAALRTPRGTPGTGSGSPGATFGAANQQGQHCGPLGYGTLLRRCASI